jgi:hypothetical protein
MAELRVTELDFAGIKSNLKTFLQAQTEFQDYNFDGSALSVLLDILAYNTHYNAMLAHAIANEQFIDTAIKRSSVVSLAKTLGYVPRSTTSAIALVNIVVTPTGTPSPTLDLPVNTLFTSSISNTSFNFSVNEAQSVSLSEGVYTFNNVELIEGARLNMTYVVQNDSVSGPFVIPNQTVDLSTVTVTVRDDASSLKSTAYTRVDSVLDATADSKIFWVEEMSNGNYAVILGDNILGSALVPGNVVNIAYIASSGSAANNAKRFTLSGTIGGSNVVSITNVNTSGAFGGAEREDIDSVRFHATKFNATRNRAVTAQDYKSLIKSQFTQVNSVAVWGGEENDPPIYGKVFVSLEPLDGQFITQDVKNHIANSIIKPRAVVSIQPEFVDPEYLYITLNIATKYDVTQTTSNAAQIAGFVSSTVTDYFNTQLGRLDTVFYYSKLVRTIDASVDCIIGSLVQMSLQKRILGLTNGSLQKLNYNAGLIPNSVRSSYFITTIGGTQYVAYLRDIPSVNPPVMQGPGSTGTIGLFARETDLLLDPNFGTIDYSTGKVIMNNMIITGYIGTLNDVRVNAVPQEASRNISPTINSTVTESIAAIYPLASRNTIIKLDDSSADAAAGIAAGLTVVATPYVEHA